MTIVNFNNLKVTTMTIVVILKGETNIQNVFPLLPITKLEISQKLKKKKKIKIPWPGKEYAGNIFSSKHKLFTRGIIKSDSKKSFRNAVGIEICTSKKHISAKLVKDKIHMCGVTSEELAIETAKRIINHLKDIQKELDYIQKNKDELRKTIKWIKTECVGDLYTVNEETEEIVILEDGQYIENNYVYDKDNNHIFVFKEAENMWDVGDSINQHNVMVNQKGEPYFRTLSKKEIKDNVSTVPYMIIGENVIIKGDGDRHPQDIKGNKYTKIVKSPLKIKRVKSIIFPQCVIDKTPYPNDIDSRICDFLIKYAQDFSYYSTFVEFLENIIDIKMVCTDVLEIDRLNIAMINYSYTLKMNINRKNLSTLIDGYQGFDASYDNTIDNHITITLPYELPEGNEKIKRKNKILCHTFMVYKSGIVTQSGPGPKIMSGAYYKFINFIEDNRDFIKQKSGKSFKIKYRPTSSEEHLRKNIMVR